jgi:hypothetical protein
MPRGMNSLPDEFRKLLDLVEYGKLFDLQEWIATGKPLQFDEVMGSRRYLLEQAIRTGFHSIVEVLLRDTGGWSDEDLAHALEFARDRSRYDISELLEKFGARGKDLDFFTACEQLDLATAERLLRSGFDPSKENDFARALSEVKAKPLIGFYKNHRAEFPVLNDQAAIALRIAVGNNRVRSAALLVWAGADPFRLAPDNLEEFFPFDPEQHNWSTAAEDAVWRADPQMLKALHLNPTPDQAVALLKATSYKHNVALFKTFLASIPREQINHSERNSCEALENLVGSWPTENVLTRAPNEQGNGEKLQCVELLLDAGGRWNPPSEKLKRDRRNLLRHDGKYIVQLIRLLLYTPNATNPSQVLELCSSQSLISKIGLADAALVTELKELRKRESVSISTHSTENMETAQASAPDS